MATKRSLRRQALTTLLVSIAGVMLVALVLSVLLLRFTLLRDFETRLRALAQDLQATVTRGQDGAIDLGDFTPDAAFSERFSGWYWLVRDGEAIVARSRSMVAESLPSSGLGETQPTKGPRGEALLALSLSVRGADGLLVTVAGPESAIDRALLDDLWIVLSSVVTLGLMLMLVVWSQVNRALKPLQDLAEDLGRLRTGALTEVPPSQFSELNAVVTLVNALLADSRNLVAQARDTAAKLAHGLKTPLALLAARFGTGGTSPDLKVTDAVDSMRCLIDQNLRTARTARASAAFSDTVPLRPVVEDLVFAFSHVFRERQLLVDVDILEDLAFRGSRDDLQEMLGNLLENAHAWAASRVSVSVGREERDDLTIAIRDDGPGFPDSILVAMTQDNSSSPADYATSPTGERAQSNGLGLRITRDIATRYNGRLELANSAGNGAVATLRLP
ncbi:sensor histidine kinase [Bradyrhizobium retamae]|nr:HAMP domain-containing sensor histidine kinase [Bradyrhizobium retamae]